MPSPERIIHYAAGVRDWQDLIASRRRLGEKTPSLLGASRRWQIQNHMPIASPIPHSCLYQTNRKEEIITQSRNTIVHYTVHHKLVNTKYAYCSTTRQQICTVYI